MTNKDSSPPLTCPICKEDFDSESPARFKFLIHMQQEAKTDSDEVGRILAKMILDITLTENQRGQEKVIPLSVIDKKIQDLETVMKKILAEYESHPLQEPDMGGMYMVSMMDLLKDIKKEAVQGEIEK